MRYSHVLATLLLAACAADGTAPVAPEFAGGKPTSPPAPATVVVLGGSGSTAEAINDQRQIVGNGGGSNLAYVWHQGVFARLAALPGAGESMALDINSSGVIVGISGGQAVRWIPIGGAYGAAEALLPPGSPGSEAWTINDAGMIGGAVGGRAFVWVDGTVTDLDALEGSGTYADGINDAGTVVGGQTTPNRAWVRYPGSSMQELPGIAGPHGWALDVNSDGIIAGYSQTEPQNDLNMWRATLWDGSSVRDLGTLGGTRSIAIALNDLDPTQVVGYASTGARRNPGRAFIWTEATGMRDLGLPKGATFAWARDINRNGWIVGWVTTGGGDRAVIWKLTGSPP